MENPVTCSVFSRWHGAAVHFVQRMLSVKFVLVTAAMTTFVSRSEAGTAYTITDLGNGGLDSADGIAINNEGGSGGRANASSPDIL